MIPRQKIAVWIGGLLMMVAAFVPPWSYQVADEEGGWRPQDVRWGFLLAPPAPETRGEKVGYGIAWATLLVEWSALAGLTFGAVIALRERRGRIKSAKVRRSARAGDIRKGRKRRA